MKLDLYNRVTVKCGGETRETHNAMFGVFTLAASCAYGACLAVGSGSGGEDGKTITPIATLATSVGDKNLGADKGDLFVRYEASRPIPTLRRAFRLPKSGFAAKRAARLPITRVSIR